MDYRIFECAYMVFRMRAYIYTHGGWVHRQRVSKSFLTRRNSKFFLCSWLGSNPRPFGSPVGQRSNHWANPSPLARRYRSGSSWAEWKSVTRCLQNWNLSVSLVGVLLLLLLLFLELPSFTEYFWVICDWVRSTPRIKLNEKTVVPTDIIKDDCVLKSRRFLLSGFRFTCKLIGEATVTF